MTTQTTQTVSKAEIARQLGISRAYATMLANGQRKPTKQIINKLDSLDETCNQPVTDSSPVKLDIDTTKYGSYYWCIKVTKDIAEDGEIYIMADSCRVLPNGELVCLGNRSRKFQDEYIINLAIAPGKWNAVYAASTKDGSPVAVDCWKGWIVQFT